MKSFWQKTIESGFTLLEIVVTLSLLAVSLVAIITVATKVLQVEYITENDFVAKGLLIEGIALVEAKRNANVDAEVPFWTDLATEAVGGSTYGFRMDYTGTGNILEVAALPTENARLKYDDTEFYQYTTGTPTKFYRRIFTTYVDNSGASKKDLLDVEIQVYWADRGGKGNTQKLATKLYEP